MLYVSCDWVSQTWWHETKRTNALTQPELIVHISEASSVVLPVPVEFQLSVLASEEHLKRSDFYECHCSLTVTAKINAAPFIIKKSRCCITALLCELWIIASWCAHHPSSTICGHVTVNLEGLALLSSHIDGVQTRGRLPIQQNLSTVLRPSVQLPD